MRRWLALALTGLLFTLACASLDDPPEEIKKPGGVAPDPVVEPSVAPVATEPTGFGWPVQAMATLPAGRTVQLPAGHQLADLDLETAGRRALVVTTDAAGTHGYTWDFRMALQPITGIAATEFALSAFDDTVYALVRGADTWTIDRGTLSSTGAWTRFAPVYDSPARLSALLAPFVEWDGVERVFFARETAPGATQIVSTRRDGSLAYELTSPSGVLGPETVEELHGRDEEGQVPPSVLQAASAVPLSIHPATGDLLWRDGDGAVHQRPWSSAVGNWGDDAIVAKSGTRTWSPNAYYAVESSPGTAGVKLVDPDGKAVSIAGPTFLGAPALAANGRTLVGLTERGLTTVAVGAALSPVRYLHPATTSPKVVASLARSGMVVSDSRTEQIYGVYDNLLYDDHPRPVFASLDGMLEVLHVGFQAVFLQVERDVARPRLEAFLAALDAAGKREELPRVSSVAVATQRMLGGDYAFPDGAAALAEISGESDLHGKPVAFIDFHPRGPYATSDDLSNYFRAFKYIDQLDLSPDERTALIADTALVAAWRGWIEVQSPYLSGSRYQGLFGDWAQSPHARADCPAKAVSERPLRPFPLSWGRDSEILERVTAHDELPSGCTVPLRPLPSGLDLLVGLGSAGARATFASEYERFPALSDAHGALQTRFAGPVDTTRFVDHWLRLVQILGNRTSAPEGVNPDRWQRRLWETALASWTNFRHTTVLVNESSAAQMGGGGPDGFEWLSTEPMRGAVDPVPDAWAELAALLDRLATHGKQSAMAGRVPEVLAEGAANARRLGVLAETQLRGEPLAEADYDFIADYAGTIEHPYLLLAATAAGKEMEISAPDPMMRIVDVHLWNNPEGSTEFWHAAVGRPREVVVLLGDRGILVPAWGAVYSYYEAVATSPLDDEAWRAKVDDAKRPPWANRTGG